MPETTHNRPPPKTHGSGHFKLSEFGAVGEDCVFEESTLVFHPENVYLGSRVYIGHQTILKGYYKNRLTIGDDVWIGQQCFLHSAGGIHIGAMVGIGPGVRILSSRHEESKPPAAVMSASLRLDPVVIGDGADVGVSTTILPGVTIGEGAQVGAGAVVARDIPAFAIAVGVPARVQRYRT